MFTQTTYQPNTRTWQLSLPMAQAATFLTRVMCEISERPVHTVSNIKTFINYKGEDTGTRLKRLGITM